MKQILDLYAEGKIDFDEAQVRLSKQINQNTEEFQLDFQRFERLGFPEIVFAESKTVEQVLQISSQIVNQNALVILSNIKPEHETALRDFFAGKNIDSAGRVMVVGESNYQAQPGKVGILTAGTSDVMYAQETALVLNSLGVEVINVYDAGVAGIHRPLMALDKVTDAHVLIVFAGMEGALPTLIAAITDKPVIAVPTPIGYGVGGKGIGAMITMLQTCAPGVLVVNIGNTIGAAAGALRILKSNKRTA